MGKRAVLKIVSRFAEALQARGIRCPRIILYGSHATGRSHEDSDIDLAVISRDFVGKGYWERIDILSAAICELWEPIEAVAMTPAEWRKGSSLIVDFARKGEVVYSGR